ncbi:MAG: T9SS type A sorting domain-containing protein [Fibromonadales bacterium]|nr:T9SS type A sorting domain-containing protein [Fibromonadales bacterium]
MKTFNFAFAILLSVVAYAQQDGAITNCYAIGNVSGTDHAGGISGGSSTVTNSYFVGNVTGTGSNVGAIIGSGTAANSYYNSDLTSANNGFGILKTTEEMKNQNTYAGWDFVNIWKILADINDGYPYFSEPGANVSSLTIANKTYNSIAINAVETPATGQTVEYAISTENIAPASGWQTELAFSGLSPNAAYYIFARSQENNIYASGIASVLQVTTYRILGANVSEPTTASITYNNITINAVTAPATGQTVEYAISTENIAPASGWQTELAFSGLSPNAAYYIFARSQENSNYYTGTASIALQVTTDKIIGADVSTPTTASITDNSITINAVAIPATGQTVEYAISTENITPASGWQTGLAFSGLSPNTTYYIFARSQENSNYYTGTASIALQVTTNKILGANVSTPATASITDNSITINAVAIPATGQTVEYAISTENITPASGWQTGLAFNGLSPNTAYYIFARSQENINYYAGTTSSALQVTTDKIIGAEISKPITASKTYNSITINAVAVPASGQVVEYAINTENNVPLSSWQTGLIFAGLSSNTVYYIFARSQENVNYYAGNASLALEETTLDLDAPTLASKTHNSITINAVTASTMETVEYAISTSNIAPASGWQTGLTLTGLAPSTTHYIFARIAGDINTASSPLEITTFQQNNWIDEADYSWYLYTLSEFTITTPEQLAGLAYIVNEGHESFSNKKIMLGNDISLNNTDSWQDWATATFAEIKLWTPIGTAANPFKGTFEGNGFTVSGIYIDNTNDNQGLFGVASGGKIEKLGVVASYVKGNNNVGGLLGNGNTAIQYCYSMANVAGASNIGGLAGNRGSGAITQSYATGNVTGTSNVGGLTGGGTGTITGSYYNSETLGGGSNGFGRTTAQMKTQSSYIGWDFATPIWKIDSKANDGYPYLHTLTACLAEGKVWENSICRDKTPAEVCTESGDNWVNGQCKSDAQIAQEACLAEGKVWENSTCRDKTPAEVCTESGNNWVDGQCKSDAQLTQEACLADGKMWENSICRDKTSAEVCTESGNNWVNGQCKSNAQLAQEACLAEGKVWENNQCTTPIRQLQIITANITAKAIGNTIILQNVPKDAKVEVYNLKGRQVYSANSENSKILVQTKGLYIVKVGKQTLKIMVR